MKMYECCCWTDCWLRQKKRSFLPGSFEPKFTCYFFSFFFQFSNTHISTPYLEYAFDSFLHCVHFFFYYCFSFSFEVGSHFFSSLFCAIVLGIYIQFIPLQQTSYVHCTSIRKVYSIEQFFFSFHNFDSNQMCVYVFALHMIRICERSKCI